MATKRPTKPAAPPAKAPRRRADEDGKTGVNIYFDDAEYALLQRAAAADGRSLRSFAKRAALAAAKNFA